MSKKKWWDLFFLNGSTISEDCFSNRIASSEGQITIKISTDPNNPETFLKGFCDKNRLDATTEAQIRLEEKEDDEQAKLDASNKNAQQC